MVWTNIVEYNEPADYHVNDEIIYFIAFYSLENICYLIYALIIL